MVPLRSSYCFVKGLPKSWQALCQAASCKDLYYGTSPKRHWSCQFDRVLISPILILTHWNPKSCPKSNEIILLRNQLDNTNQYFFELWSKFDQEIGNFKTHQNHSPTIPCKRQKGYKRGSKFNVKTWTLLVSQNEEEFCQKFTDRKNLCFKTIHFGWLMWKSRRIRHKNNSETKQNLSLRKWRRTTPSRSTKRTNETNIYEEKLQKKEHLKMLKAIVIKWYAKTNLKEEKQRW